MTIFFLLTGMFEMFTFLLRWMMGEATFNLLT